MTVRTADATPLAASLIESLRDVGYSLETALADIIDNSITAGAGKVDIVAETASGEPLLAVLDDGAGMDEAALLDAMRPGSRNPLDDRPADDLGRFGLGLKTASFSQCRRLTVVSRRNGVLSAAVWDLDHVAASNRWEVLLPENPEDIPLVDRLPRSGTLVIWEKLDRFSGSAPEAERTAVLNAALARAEDHLRLVFHRFMSARRRKLTLRLNGRALTAADPFMDRHDATIRDPEEPIAFGDTMITVQAVTLPHRRMVREAEWREAGGPEGHLRNQGFYVYRNDRLIIHGTWFGLLRQTEITQLSRVRIDIPNTLDASWKIDVRKASAQLPPQVRERLRRIIERIAEGSRRTYSRRGRRLVEPERRPVWKREPVGDHIEYRIDRSHPVLDAFAARLPPDLVGEFRICVDLIAGSLPIDALFADLAGGGPTVASSSVEDDTLAAAVRGMAGGLAEAGVSPDEIRTMMRAVDPYRARWVEVETMLNAILREIVR